MKPKKPKLPRLPKGWKKVGDARSPGVRYYGEGTEKELLTGYTYGEVYIYIYDTGSETTVYIPVTVAKYFHAMLGEAIRKAEDNG